MSVDRIDIDPMQVMQATILHDVLEDTATTVGDLRAAGYNDDILTMVGLVTKREDDSTYADAITRIIEGSNLGAILIKMSDNEDNLSPERTLSAGDALPARYRASFA